MSSKGQASLKVFTVKGSTKDTEEFKSEEDWRRKLEIIEENYDQSLDRLQKDLFTSKVNSRVIHSLRDKNLRLRAQLNLEERRVSTLQVRLNKLQSRKNKEVELKSEVTNFKELANVKESELKRTESLYRTATRNEGLAMRRTLISQTEKARVAAALNSRDNQLGVAREELKVMEKRSQMLVCAIKKVEEEKRLLQGLVNKGEHSKGFMQKKKETEEEALLRLKQELQSVLNQLTSVEQKCNELSREKQLTENNLTGLRNELKQVLSEVRTSSLEKKYWKEEATRLKIMAEAPPKQRLSIPENHKNLQKTHSDSAEITRQIQMLESRLNSLEGDKVTLKNQLKSSLSLHKSLIRVYHNNFKKRTEFEQKLKETNFCCYAYARKSQQSQFPAETNTGIETQSQKLHLLESDLLHTKRAYNALKFKLEQNDELAKNLSMAQTTAWRAERERRDAERIASLTAQKLGRGIFAVRDPLLGNLVTQIDFLKEIRSSLLPLSLRTAHGHENESKRELNLDNHNGLLDKIRILERKQAVYANIQAAKEQKLVDAQTLETVLDDDDKEYDFEESVEDRSDTENEESDMVNSPTESTLREENYQEPPVAPESLNQL